MVRFDCRFDYKLNAKEGRRFGLGLVWWVGGLLAGDGGADSFAPDAEPQGVIGLCGRFCRVATV